jgi:hypothetical protein
LKDGQHLQYLIFAVTFVLALGSSRPTLGQDLKSSVQDTQQEALRARLQKIDRDREASQAQFRSDKKSCASTVLVSRCVTDSVSRRRARDTVLRDDQVSAKEQLRAISATTKSSELAASQARLEQQSGDDDAKREEGNAQRAKKLADVQERVDAHQQKKNQEAENRRLYLEKVQRSEEKQAEIRARFKANGTQPKANAFMSVPPALPATPAAN